jgi:hypothetical protein
MAMPTEEKKFQRKKKNIEIPYDTRKLLEFANLGRIPGKLSLPERTIEDGQIISTYDVKTFKRRLDLKNIDIDKLQWHPRRGSGPFKAADLEGNVLQKETKDSKERLIGKRRDLLPGKKEVEDFFRKVSFPSQVFAVHDYDELPNRHLSPGKFDELLVICCQIRDIFIFMALGVNVDEFFYDAVNTDEGFYPGIHVNSHDGIQSFSAQPPDYCAWAVSWLANFYIGQRNLHKSLKQCRCCESFFIAKTMRKIFCSLKCQTAFNRQSTAVKRQQMRDYREPKVEKRRDAEWEKLSSALDSWDASPKVRTDAKNWIYKKKKTFKQYLKFYGLDERTL